MKQAKNLQPVHMRLTQEQLREIETICASEGTSKSAILRRAASDFLRRQRRFVPPEGRESQQTA